MGTVLTQPHSIDLVTKAAAQSDGTPNIQLVVVTSHRLVQEVGAYRWFDIMVPTQCKSIDSPAAARID